MALLVSHRLRPTRLAAARAASRDPEPRGVVDDGAEA
jgi:hypothetical protein